jgi:iron complex transport system ATP-binding protein
VNALALDRVSVTLGGARVVDRLSVHVEDGEWVAIIGPNGAGKTTALRAVAGLVGYEGGVRVLDEDARALPRKQLARRVALVPQVPLIPGDITVREYVLLGRTPHVGYFGSERRADLVAADAALDQLDLVPFRQRRLDTLSGGERQRATLARALAQDAPILLLD